jgi:hypothetical protein
VCAATITGLAAALRDIRDANPDAPAGGYVRERAVIALDLANRVRMLAQPTLGCPDPSQHRDVYGRPLPQPAPEPAARGFVDLRCDHAHHADRSAYRMVGRCRNCTAEVLGLHTVGHAADHGISGPDCPVCGINAIGWNRLATADEIPAGFEAQS